MMIRKLLLSLFVLLLSVGSLLAKDGDPIHINNDGTSTADERKDLEVSAYGGIAVDTFLAQEVQHYLNYDSATGTRERGIAGVDFSYRVTQSTSAKFPAQLWISGETLYGVRSTEIDCSNDQFKQLPVCGTFSAATVASGTRNFYIMRNASSVEGSVGLRFEFLRLNPTHEASASLYVKSQVGFQSVAKGASDAADDHIWLALGTIVTKGEFKNSFFEVGRGRSDVFTSSPRNRWKLDGYVEFPLLAKHQDFIRPFIEMLVNADGGPKSDAIQTFFGFNFDIKKLMGE